MLRQPLTKDDDLECTLAILLPGRRRSQLAFVISRRGTSSAKVAEDRRFDGTTALLP